MSVPPEMADASTTAQTPMEATCVRATRGSV